MVGEKSPLRSKSLNERNRLWLLKKGCVESESSGSEHHSWEEFLTRVRRLIAYRERWSWSLAEEADQSFDILCSRSQEELLANKLESPQTQTTKSDLVLQFRKQSLHLLSLSLRLDKRWRID